MVGSNVNKVIEEFSQLPPEDKEYVAEIITKQVTDVKRERLAERSRQARMNLEKASVKTGTIKDMREDLDLD